MMGGGGLDFLRIDGTPDPGGPGVTCAEAQRGSSPLPAGTPGPESKTPESREQHIATTAPQPRNRGPANFPDPQIGGLEFLSLNPVLEDSNMPNLPATQDPQLFDDKESYYQFSPEQQRFLRYLAKYQRVTRAAEMAGVNRTSMYALKSRNSDFADLWRQAEEYKGDLLEDEAMRRAVNGVEEPVFYMGAICGYKRVYSDALLGKLLEGNKPEKYRTNHKVEVEGNVGVATLVLPATTSAEDWIKQNQGTIIDQLPESEYD